MKLYILQILCAILITASFICLTIAEKETKIVNCYDKFNNEIIGQKCYSENMINSPINIMHLIIITGSLMVFISLTALIMMGFEDIKEVFKK